MINLHKYGIFINHRHDHCHLAGRIYDFFNAKGIKPFLDIYSLRQAEYRKEIFKLAAETPYFLCVLTKESLDNLNPDDPNDVYYNELRIAFENQIDKQPDGKVKILVIADEDFKFSDIRPSDDTRITDLISKIEALQYYPINMRNFYDELEKLYTNDINLELLNNVINWREQANRKNNVFITSRMELEEDIASLRNRFGNDFVEHVLRKEKFNAPHRVKQINMSCYAASLIFAPGRNLVDQQSYDYGMMFNIFSQLLYDNEFSMTIITNAPGSPPTADAIKTNKLGNDALADNPNAIFLVSYANICKLLENEPYHSAKQENRFKYLLTKNILPFAFFQIIYKNEWREFNHIKIDLYTEGVQFSANRRSMIIFEKDNPETYRFFEQQFAHLKNREKHESAKLIKSKHNVWIEQWNKISSELNITEEKI